MSSLSTHVLDTAKGGPAMGVPVSLSRWDGSSWTELGKGETNDDGRIPGLLGDSNEIGVGRYQMHFDTQTYFEREGIEGFYPWAEVVFEVRKEGQHYHVPLLLSPFGYSTYRGS